MVRGNVTVVLLVLATGVIALAFAPGTREVAVVWWVVGLLLLIMAGRNAVVTGDAGGGKTTGVGTSR